MSYIIKKNKKKYNIIYMEYDLDGYIFKPKNKFKNNLISVKEVNIINKEFISYLITRKFKSRFNKLSDIILNLLYQDDEGADQGDYLILLDEIDRLRSVVEIKYKKYLDNDNYREYLAKLMFLDQQLREKIAIYNYREQLVEVNNIGRSR